MMMHCARWRSSSASSCDLDPLGDDGGRRSHNLAGSRSNRPIEILDQVLRIFEPYAHPNEAVRDPADPSFLVGEETVCHGCGMLDEGLGASEAHGERCDVDGFDELHHGPVTAR